jgi:hypothetical protein
MALIVSDVDFIREEEDSSKLPIPHCFHESAPN